MSGVRKAQVDKIMTISPAAADQRKRHFDCHFVVVIGPSTVEIEAHIRFGSVKTRSIKSSLNENVLDMQTPHAKHIRVLPDGVEGHDTAQ